MENIDLISIERPENQKGKRREDDEQKLIKITEETKGWKSEQLHQLEVWRGWKLFLWESSLWFLVNACTILQTLWEETWE